MKKREILVVGEVSYKIFSGLNSISSKYTARKSTIGSDNVVEVLEGYPPDILVTFIDNLDEGYLSKIKKTFDKLNYKSIPVICVGTNGECNIFSAIFNEYTIYNILLPLSIEKLNNTIIRILETHVEIENENSEPQLQYTKDLDKKNILVVDDDVKMLRLISAYLEEDYKVSVVNSGAAAIAYLGKKKPDLILLDYLMPICDGKQTLQMIREVKGMQDIPVIFLTGVSDRSVVEECLRLNPQGYILKPVAKEKILEKLNEIFYRK